MAWAALKVVEVRVLNKVANRSRETHDNAINSSYQVYLRRILFPLSSCQAGYRREWSNAVAFWLLRYAFFGLLSLVLLELVRRRGDYLNTHQYDEVLFNAVLLQLSFYRNRPYRIFPIFLLEKELRGFWIVFSNLVGPQKRLPRSCQSNGFGSQIFSSL